MSHPVKKLSQLPGTLFLILFCQILTVYAQENPCDPNLNPRSKDPLRYERRGDRCEGLYYQGKTSAALSLVSLTETFDEYNLKSAQPLLVEWNMPKAQKIQIRAQSVKPGLFYRMDTIRASGETAYRWPTDVLRPLSISRRDIGLVGWALYSLDGSNRNVYLPLRITQNRRTSSAQNYQVQIWPVRELQEVFVSIATIKSDGGPARFLQDGNALGYGYYPAERAITFKIPKPENPGIYYLEIGATLRNGGVVTIEHWFYHAG